MAPPALLAIGLAPAAPAQAQAARPAEPPSEMSEVGGELLGRSGTQVLPDADAPELPEELSARAWIVADAESGEVLAAHNAHWPLAPASTLKMLFADTLLPKFASDEVYRARPEDFAELGAGASAVGIDDGRTYTVDDLWNGVFLASGGDAVYALTAMNGGTEATVAEMNARAEELQALDTHVVNPDGYDADGQVSSAYDLTLIARAGMQNPDFRDYAATPTADFPGAGRGENRETYEIQNTNRLLVGDFGLEAYDGIAGIKNGYTSDAGHTFTGVAERGGQVLLVTCLDPRGDSLEVYRETAALFDWGFEASGRVDPVGTLVPPLSEVEDPEGSEGAAGAAGADQGQGNQNGEDAPEGQQDGTEQDASLDGASASENGEGVGAGTVLAFTLAGLAVLAAAAFVFHRRHPLPLTRGGRPPGATDGGGGAGSTPFAAWLTRAAQAARPRGQNRRASQAGGQTGGKAGGQTDDQDGRADGQEGQTDDQDGRDRRDRQASQTDDQASRADGQGDQERLDRRKGSSEEP
ncbi:D-alanyl-D-alanine carboxypeptidase [Streptomyces sp. B6B3]|uniref:D-alanyl-D-alanine carboxypeptidase family protein n=1 Tax=Streptomyces sp. B6B3 TaxID=3153570 RepID=UPI00325D2C00